MFYKISDVRRTLLQTFRHKNCSNADDSTGNKKPRDKHCDAVRQRNEQQVEIANCRVTRCSVD